MIKLKDIIEKLEKLAPPSLAEKWDNVGLMIGDFDQPVRNIYVCLDVTSENVQKAIDFGADLIISHHPLLFKPLKRVVESDVNGGIIRLLIRNNISVYSMHTNFDKADGGMNDLLAEKLGLCEIRKYDESECLDELMNPTENIGRVGILKESLTMEEFANMVSASLNCSNIKFVGDPCDSVKTVAVCSGAGGDCIYNAYRSGADVYVTSDVRHHEAQLASELGIGLIDAGHFETENIFCEFLLSFLLNEFADVNVRISNVTSFFS